MPWYGARYMCKDVKAGCYARHRCSGSVHVCPSHAQKALHIGWVPFIIGLALVSTEPRPNLLQMVTPM